jgi:hypothetical protein
MDQILRGREADVCVREQRQERKGDKKNEKCFVRICICESFQEFSSVDNQRETIRTGDLQWDGALVPLSKPQTSKYCRSKETAFQHREASKENTLTF